jgi:hypothetical protein
MLFICGDSGVPNRQTLGAYKALCLSVHYGHINIDNAVIGKRLCISV